MASSNALHPDLMTPAERLDEIAEILAAGILRARARQRATRGSTGEQIASTCRPGRAKPFTSTSETIYDAGEGQPA